MLAHFRYPNDQYDRIWKNPDPEAVPTSTPISFKTSIYNANTTVPLKVLQTALTHTDKLEFLHSDLDRGNYSYTVFLYFLELNYSVKTGQRVFDIYINNEMQQEKFDILANGSNYREVSLSVTANGSLNLTLAKTNGSDLDPILNAYEILQEHQWVPGTNQQDGKSNSSNVQKHINLYFIYTSSVKRHMQLLSVVCCFLVL